MSGEKAAGGKNNGNNGKNNAQNNGTMRNRGGLARFARSGGGLIHQAK
jgi:hypothetical protein